MGRNMTSNEVRGRTAVVTGASSGIGQAVAEHLGALGAKVWMCGRTEEPLQESCVAIEGSGGSADYSVFDISDISVLRSFIQDASAADGLHVMVNNAGFGDADGILTGDPESWRSMLDVNVVALAAGAQAAVAAMRTAGSEGHIINISSIAALRRDSGMYGATKHAVNAVNATLREELEDDLIRVTSIMPGVFATNFIRNMDRAMVEAFAGSVGITDLSFDDQGRLSREQNADLQRRLAPMVGDVNAIARAVEYVITQPIDLNIEEIVIRPRKSLPL